MESQGAPISRGDDMKPAWGVTDMDAATGAAAFANRMFKVLTASLTIADLESLGERLVNASAAPVAPGRDDKPLLRALGYTL